MGVGASGGGVTCELRRGRRVEQGRNPFLQHGVADQYGRGDMLKQVPAEVLRLGC